MDPQLQFITVFIKSTTISSISVLDLLLEDHADSGEPDAMNIFAK
jgi:hypothetical protein